MQRTWIPPATVTLSAIALGCWVLAFLAGHDVWHDMGRPDFVRQGATLHDVRALAFAFYSMPVVLCAQLGVTALGFLRGRHSR